MKLALDSDNFYVGGDELSTIKGILARDDEEVADLMGCIDMALDWPDVLLEPLQEALRVMQVYWSRLM